MFACAGEELRHIPSSMLTVVFAECDCVVLYRSKYRGAGVLKTVQLGKMTCQDTVRQHTGYIMSVSAPRKSFTTLVLRAL